MNSFQCRPALERLHQAILADVERVVGEAVERAIAEKCKG
jgi:hypothetical protein